VTSAYAYGSRIPLGPGKCIELAGRGGTQLTLLPGGPPFGIDAQQQYTWTPEVVLPPPIDPRDVNAKRIAKLPSDYDVQILWLSAEKPINNPPYVFWRLEYGHGESVYDLPFRSFGPPPAGSPVFPVQVGWMLPQRGLRLRVPARELRFNFFVPPVAEPPPEPVVPGGAPCVIQISVQPCNGMTPEQLPITDMVYGGDPAAQLPLGATEMRFSDPNSGLSYAAATAYVQFWDVTGAAVGGPVDTSLYGAWAPIPIFAAFWQPTAFGGDPPVAEQVLQVSYR
jgi:hypothetical protein